MSMASLAIAWVLSRPGLTSAIVGPRNPEQLRDLLSAADLKLPDDIAARLDAHVARPRRAGPRSVCVVIRWTRARRVRCPS